jgi:ribosomal protein S18 acetylase RimI-like enzyme
MQVESSTKGTWCVERAERSDAQKIYEIVNEAYTRDFFRYPKRPRASYETIEKFFESTEHTWYVVRCYKDKLPFSCSTSLSVAKNRISHIACVVLYSTDKAPETGQQGNIHMLAAPESEQGKYWSIPLLQEVERRAFSDNKSTISLVVANTNEGLIRLYESQGYRKTGQIFNLPDTSVQPQFREKNLDGSDKIHCVYMRKILRPLIRSHL